MSTASRFSLVSVLLVAAVPAQNVPPSAEPVDRAAVDILRQHGLEQSQVMDLLSQVCDVYGPRLTGSPGIRRAREWAVRQLGEWGLKARQESWGPFGKSWQLEHVSARVVGDNPWPVLAYPKAWSPSVDKVVAEVVLVAGMEASDLEAMDLSDKILLMDDVRSVQEPFDGVSKRFGAEDLLAKADGRRLRRSARVTSRARGDDARRGFQKRIAMMKLLASKKPLALFDRSYKGDYGTVFVGGASTLGTGSRERPRAYSPGAQVLPQFTLAVEHYNRMVRLLRLGRTVSVELEMRASESDGVTSETGEVGMEANVVADLPGSDPELRQQLVMVGAHFDSWHTGTGSTDNGCGSAVMMEAMRLLTVLANERDDGPRRTIRLGLWSGEEQGLLGSRAYVAQHFAKSASRRAPPTEIAPAHALLSGYFNLDNGTGRVRGVYLQGNEAVAPIFRAWLRPFHDLDATTLTLDNTGGTDHLSFDTVGLPGFQFIQDPVSYNTRTHHSNMDTWDHAVAEDLQQAATIIASFAWHTAQRDDMLPRKFLELPEPATTEASVPAEAGARRGR